MESFIFLLATFSLTACQGIPTQGAGKLAFLALGDAGGYAWWPYYTKTMKKVAKAMGKVADATHARFVVGLGDNFYWNGVKNVHDFRFRVTFENIFTAPALNRTTWHMIAGNHDYLGNVSAQIAYTKVSRRWNFPDYYYTTVETIPGTCNTVQIVMIDTTLFCYRCGSAQQKQKRWIEETLKNSRADYLVVAGHHPVYSAGMHGTSPCLVEQLKPLLETYDVTAYLSGHDHNLQHIKERDSDIHYFVSGSVSNHNGLKPNERTLPEHSLMYFNGGTGAFTFLQATPEALQVTFISDHGIKLHSTTIPPRRKTCVGGDNATVDMIENFEDSVLEAFFGLQEEQERRRHFKHTSSSYSLADDNYES